jgi:hypothetical protein
VTGDQVHRPSLTSSLGQPLRQVSCMRMALTGSTQRRTLPNMQRFRARTLRIHPSVEGLGAVPVVAVVRDVQVKEVVVGERLPLEQMRRLRLIDAVRMEGLREGQRLATRAIVGCARGERGVEVEGLVRSFEVDGCQLRSEGKEGQRDRRSAQFWIRGRRVVPLLEVREGGRQRPARAAAGKLKALAPGGDWPASRAQDAGCA